MSWAKAIDELVRERGPALFGFAYVLTGDAGEAEDLVHDALVRTFRRQRRVENINTTHAYVKRAITTAFLDRARRAQRRPRTVPGDIDDVSRDYLIASSTQEPSHDVSVAATIDTHRALLTLPPRERACVVMRYLDDQPVAVVAAELGLSEGSVKRYVHDGLQRLRHLVPDIDTELEIRIRVSSNPGETP